VCSGQEGASGTQTEKSTALHRLTGNGVRAIVQVDPAHRLLLGLDMNTALLQPGTVAARLC
jgi:hypothetical protein